MNKIIRLSDYLKKHLLKKHDSSYSILQEKIEKKLNYFSFDEEFKSSNIYEIFYYSKHIFTFPKFIVETNNIKYYSLVQIDKNTIALAYILTIQTDTSEDIESHVCKLNCYCEPEPIVEQYFDILPGRDKNELSKNILNLYFFLTNENIVKKNIKPF